MFLVNKKYMVCPSSDSRLGAILEAVIDAVVIIDEDKKIQSFSAAAERLFGYSAAEVLGQNVNVLMPEPYRSRHDHYINQYISSGEKHIIGIGREVTALRKDGTHFSAYLSVGEGYSGDGRFFVAILHDLSREKVTFRKMRELAAIVDSTGDAVLGKTLDGIITYWNKGAEELYGYSAGEAIGRPITELIVPEDKKRELEKIFQSIRDGQGITRIETARKDKSGKRLIVALTISPILDVDGKVIGASAIARDITARRLAEKAQAQARRAAEEANRIKSDFLSIVSHELRTPLTVILGNISLLTDNANMPAPGEAAEIARDIEESAGQLLVLINNLLDISDMEAGQATLRLTPVQAEDMVREIVQSAESMASAKGISVSSFSEPIEFLADPLRLKQALFNLVDNAVKFSESGTITIGVERMGDNAVFQVGDTGPGIPAEAIDHIFDSFHQGDTSITRRAQGSGLGLTIVKQIVQLHKGTMHVESLPGKGSVFRISLPISREDDETAGNHAQ